MICKNDRVLHIYYRLSIDIKYGNIINLPQNALLTQLAVLRHFSFVETAYKSGRDVSSQRPDPTRVEFCSNAITQFIKIVHIKIYVELQYEFRSTSARSYKSNGIPLIADLQRMTSCKSIHCLQTASSTEFQCISCRSPVIAMCGVWFVSQILSDYVINVLLHIHTKTCLLVINPPFANFKHNMAIALV